MSCIWTCFVLVSSLLLVIITTRFTIIKIKINNANKPPKNVLYLDSLWYFRLTYLSKLSKGSHIGTRPHKRSASVTDMPGPGAYRYKSSINPMGVNPLSTIQNSCAPLIGGTSNRFKANGKKYEAPGPR